MNIYLNYSFLNVIILFIQLSDELLEYSKEPTISIKDDAIMWWKARSNLYPSIFKIFDKYLCSQATSVESERIFSIAKYIVSEKRNRLCDENIDILIFLSKNKFM